jgi:hypothetical protein
VSAPDWLEGWMAHCVRTGETFELACAGADASVRPEDRAYWTDRGYTALADAVRARPAVRQESRILKV